jgi:hypothetical protein
VRTGRKIRSASGAESGCLKLLRARKCNTYVDQHGHKTFVGDAKDADSSDAGGWFGTRYVAECAERHIFLAE